MDVRVEQYFFDYAFPCTYQKLHEQKITEEEYAELERMFIANQAPSKEFLERIYSPAFVFIRKLANKMKRDLWDREVMEKYWEEEHNAIIDRGEGVYAKAPEPLKDLCRILIGEVESIIKDKHMYVVKYNGNRRNVFDYKVADARVGERIKIHHFYALKKFS